ncbi:MAG: SLBB domain-containing protein, partial [Burkholderiales bacterium]|nr:SLBB domain-containing protein [Burkholderiales bacterium]
MLAQAGRGALPPPRLEPPQPAVAPSPSAIPGDFGAAAPALQPSPPDKSESGTGSGSPGETYLPEVGPSVTPDYILGAGDVVAITDFSSGDLNTPYQATPAPILPDGTIQVHNVGVLRAAGLSLSEFNRQINKLAEKYIIKPNIEVSVLIVRPTKVYVLGEVTKPGLFSNDAGGNSVSGTPLALASRASLTVTGALQLAGGLRESADVRRIVVTRLGRKEPITINLWQLVVGGDAVQDIPLLPGDVIFVPRGGIDYQAESLGLVANQARRVRIWGAVSTPGLYDLSPDDDLLSMIARAGGFTKTAITSWVTLSRVDRNGSVTTIKMSVNKKRTLSDPHATVRSHVKPGDLIIVHQSLVKLAAASTYNQVLFLGTGSLLIFFSALINRAVFQTGNNSTNTVIPVVPAGGTAGTSP